MSNAMSARSPRSVEVRVAAQLENLAVVRTVIGALATFEDLDLDAVADLRLAVDEACTRVMKATTPDSVLVVVVDPRPGELVVDVCAASELDVEEVLAHGSFSWHVLTSLTDDVQVFNDGIELGGAGPVVGISLTSRRASSAR
ncbi:MAG: ATP-binding protein [Mycobacterium sp.]